MSMENRVYIRDIIPGKKYPKGTVFVQDEGRGMVQPPTKEEFELFKQERDDADK